jgi:hypothetical protein
MTDASRLAITLSLVAVALAGGVALEDKASTEPAAKQFAATQPAFNPVVLPEMPAEERKSDPPAKTWVDPVTGMSVSKSAVILLSTMGCKPCDQWWAKYAEPLRSAGWQVEQVYGVTSGIRSYPSARIFTRGEWQTFHGGPTYDDLRAIVENKKPPINTVFKRVRQ